MNFSLHVKPPAEQDIIAAYDWYEKQRPGIGRDWIGVVEDALRKIQENPFAHPDIHHGIRRTVVRRFPYRIYFHVEGETIVVMAVMHAKRHPRRWQSRINK